MQRPANLGRPTLNSIQYLRAIAALMVTWHHARTRLPGLFELLPNPIGEAGVDLFFVISGFIMVVTTAGRDVRPAAFMLRRTIRIVPAYWLYTTAVAIVAIALPGVLTLELTLPHYVQSLLFIPHVEPDGRSLEPLLQQGWTLNYEMFFYCLFALGLAVSAPYRTPAVVATIVGLVGLGQLAGPDSPAFRTYTGPLLLEFAFGVVIGFLFTSGWLPGKLSRPAAWSLITAGSVTALYAATFVRPHPLDTFYDSMSRIATYGTAAVLVVVGALELEATARRRNRLPPFLSFLKLTGDASYSLYLNHLFSIVALKVVWLHLDLGTGGVVHGMAFMAASVALAVSVAIGSYIVLERPITERLQRRLMPLLKGASPAAR